ncbi:30S ribosomal protein S3 [bacterium]|nr:30S ribosomal protein S3 [bacterium]
MSHKTNPKVLRVRGLKDWLSRGYYGKNLAPVLEEDLKIRNFLQKKLSSAAVENIEIERSGSLLKVIINTARPALVIGRGGRDVERLQKSLKKIVEEPSAKKSSRVQQVKIEIKEVKNFWESPNLCAQWISQQLEKRVPYRKVLKMALSKIMAQKAVKGAKVEVSGRLNGVEIARTEWLGEGQLPRTTLRAVVDYGFQQAYCKYGVIGVKVWIYKGERK